MAKKEPVIRVGISIQFMEGKKKTPVMFSISPEGTLTGTFYSELSARELDLIQNLKDALLEYHSEED